MKYKETIRRCSYIWFLHDEAPPHYSRVREHLNNAFPNGQDTLNPSCTHPTPYDFFCIGHIYDEELNTIKDFNSALKKLVMLCVDTSVLYLNVRKESSICIASIYTN